MKIKTTIEINATTAATWDVLGEQFAHVYEWAGSILKSSLDGPLDLGAVRTCDIKATGPVAAGKITEEITHFDRESHSLTYNVTSGAPGLMKSIENAWSIETLSDDRCEVTSNATFELKWWALPMSPLMRISLVRALRSFTGELKARVENG